MSRAKQLIEEYLNEGSGTFSSDVDSFWGDIVDQNLPSTDPSVSKMADIAANAAPNKRNLLKLKDLIGRSRFKWKRDALKVIDNIFNGMYRNEFGKLEGKWGQIGEFFSLFRQAIRYNDDQFDIYNYDN